MYDRCPRRGHADLSGRLIDPLQAGLHASTIAGMTELRVGYGTCCLCEAGCGIEVRHDGTRAESIRGDERDPMSRGYVCPKVLGLKDIQEDPARLRSPLRRRGERFEEIGWDEALSEAAERLARVQRQHGRDAVAFYYGNPTAHDYATLLSALAFSKNLRTRNLYSSNSIDALPRLLVSWELYGNQGVIPIPDVDRTDFLLIIGANPAVSNGSIMTAPNMVRRLRALRERGARLVVVDPRRTETAKLADTHCFIRPGTDALLLAAMLRTLFVRGVSKSSPFADGVDELRAAVDRFRPETVSASVGIAAADIERLALDFAAAPTAVCYGRMGTCVQDFGTTATWLCDALNVLTGNLDRRGGAMFPEGAVDLPQVAKLIGQTGTFARFGTRVRGLPEFNGELPCSALAEEIDSAAPERVRALITHAGNPVMSLANGRRLERAFGQLDFMLSIDIYLNETTRHADLILPTSFGLEHDHYPLLFNSLSVHNYARYSPPLLAKPVGTRHGWEIFVDLLGRLGREHGIAGAMAGKAQSAFLRRVGPRGLLALLLRLGPRGLGLAELEERPHGIDFGPLEPRLERVLATKSRRIRLAPERLVRDLDRLERTLATTSNGTDELLLIGRRSLRSNNSWMHNCERLVKGKPRCTLLMHPDDAAARGLGPGTRVEVRSRVGAVELPLEIASEIMPGVVSMPHGWGHASVNDVTDEQRVDPLSGNASISGVPVRVVRAPGSA